MTSTVYYRQKFKPIPDPYRFCIHLELPEISALLQLDPAFLRHILQLQVVVPDVIQEHSDPGLGREGARPQRHLPRRVEELDQISTLELNRIVGFISPGH